MVDTLQASVPTLDSMFRANEFTVWDKKILGEVHLRVGEWAEIKYEYAPGVCSDGGVGIIKHVHAGTSDDDFEVALGEAEKVDVKYTLDGRLEKFITLDRVTIIPMPYVSSKGPTLRKRKGVVMTSSAETFSRKEKKKSPLEWLKGGSKTRKHCKVEGPVVSRKYKSF